MRGVPSALVADAASFCTPAPFLRHLRRCVWGPRLMSQAARFRPCFPDPPRRPLRLDETRWHAVAAHLRHPSASSASFVSLPRGLTAAWRGVGCISCRPVSPRPAIAGFGETRLHLIAHDVRPKGKHTATARRSSRKSARRSRPTFRRFGLPKSWPRELERGATQIVYTCLVPMSRPKPSNLPLSLWERPGEGLRLFPLPARERARVRGLSLSLPFGRGRVEGLRLFPLPRGRGPG